MTNKSLTLAQANAGLGDLIAAQSALDKAYSLNPALPFATADQVEKLKKAIKPQTSLITKVEEPSHGLRNFVITFIVLLLGLIGYKKYKLNCEEKKAKLEAEEEARRKAHRDQRASTARAKEEAQSSFKKSQEEQKFNTGGYTKSDTNFGNRYADTNAIYTTQQAGNTTEVHHHYHNNNTDNTGSVIASAAIGAVTGAVIAESMHNHREEPARQSVYDRSYAEREQEARNNISSTWNDNSTSVSSSWNDDSEKVSKT